MNIGRTLEKALNAHKAGRFGEAARGYDHILKKVSKNPKIWHLRAILYLQNDHYKDGLFCLEKALALDPSNTEYLLTMAEAQGFMEYYNEASINFRKILEQKPNHLKALLGLGTIYRNQGLFADAEQLYRSFLKDEGDCVKVINDLGNVYFSMGDYLRALETWSRGILLEPESSKIMSNMGRAYSRLQQFEKAFECSKKAIQGADANGAILSNHANLCKDAGDIPSAIAYYRKALAKASEDHKIASNLLLALNYQSGVSDAQLYADHVDWVNHYKKKSDDLSSRPLGSLVGRRLRVGFISRDFRYHSVSFFLHAFLRAFDSESLEVYCYYTGKNEDEMSKTLKSLATVWRSCFAVSDVALARLVLGDEIDVLVDLSGHTAGNRLGVFTYRPAPVQVSWLGYPNTTGLDCIDYRLTDGIVDPEDSGVDAFYSETLYRLPGFLCYSFPTKLPEVQEPPSSNGSPITFGSFNIAAKISDETVSVWASILKQLPDSRLMLKAKGLENPLFSRRLLARFEAEGIRPERILLKNRTEYFEEHIVLYHGVDIALDPFPYNGTTTTCEALSMGVPVVALEGHRHAARVGKSLLSRIGLEALVAPDEGAYVATAIELALNQDLLKSLRKTMRLRLEQSPLMDAPAFARSLEASFRDMYQKKERQQSGAL